MRHAPHCWRAIFPIAGAIPFWLQRGVPLYPQHFIGEVNFTGEVTTFMQSQVPTPILAVQGFDRPKRSSTQPR